MHLLCAKKKERVYRLPLTKLRFDCLHETVLGDFFRHKRLHNPLINRPLADDVLDDDRPAHLALPPQACVGLDVEL